MVNNYKFVKITISRYLKVNEFWEKYPLIDIKLGHWIIRNIIFTSYKTFQLNTRNGQKCWHQSIESILQKCWVKIQKNCSFFTNKIFCLNNWSIQNYFIPILESLECPFVFTFLDNTNTKRMCKFTP